MRTLYPFIIFTISLSTYAFAQEADTLINMQPIEIVSTRYQLPVVQQPTFTVVIDSTWLSVIPGQSFGELLGQFSSIFIKSNAPGAVSTASFRGFGGEQTRVLWEGMQINHSMLGLVDFSLLRSASFSSVEVSPGSSSSMYGSGISGSVALTSDLKKDSWQVSQSVGSNGNKISSADIGKQIQKWSFGLSGAYQHNDNDYRYFDRNTQQIENRKHAQFDNIQAQAQVAWKSESTQFNSKFWYLTSDHNIPENVFVGAGTARQFDAAYRWVNSFKFRKGRYQHSLKSYLAQTELDYFDEKRNINSVSTSREWNNEWQIQRYFSETLRLINVVSTSFAEVETNNYYDKKFRSILSEQVSLEWNPTLKFRIFPNLRIDSYNDFGIAVSPSLGANYQLREDQFYLQTQISRNFRAPTFNDLYWPQGGNENLSPETALKSEFGVGITDEYLKIGEHNLTFFRADVSDGIRWTPGGGNFFQAQNYLSLLSYGAEWSASKSFRFGNFITRYSHSASYTRATIDKSRFVGDQAVNNQLPYVPKWKYSGTIATSIQNFTMLFASRWVSERFSTEQNNVRNPEPAYFINDASVSYNVDFNNTFVQFQLNVNNLFNQQYEIVRLYPQPLRNFLFSIIIKH